MGEHDERLIEQYFAHELTEAERIAFGKRRLEDAAFDEDVKDYELSIQALKLQHRDTLRQQFSRYDSDLDQETTNPSANDRVWLRWLSAAAIILLLIALLWYYYRPKASPALPSQEERIDTLLQHQTPSMKDSIGIHSPSGTESEIPKSKDSVKPQSTPNPQQKKAQELFADNFEPYRDPMMDPTTRGGELKSTLEQFRSAYWDGRYTEVQVLFQNLGPTNKANDNYRFQLANALLQTDKTDEAISILTSIINHSSSRYVPESHYYLGLAYLHNNDIVRAMEWLDKYTRLEKGKQTEKARIILSTLRN